MRVPWAHTTQSVMAIWQDLSGHGKTRQKTRFHTHGFHGEKRLSPSARGVHVSRSCLASLMTDENFRSQAVDCGYGMTPTVPARCPGPQIRRPVFLPLAFDTHTLKPAPESGVTLRSPPTPPPPLPLWKSMPANSPATAWRQCRASR